MAELRMARPDRATERRLWFAIMAPAAAWTLVELIGVSVVGRRCLLGGDIDAALNTSLRGWQWLVLIGVALAGLATALLSLRTGLRIFRRWRSEDVGVTRAEGWNRVEFMALVGVIFSAALLLNILYFAVIPLIVNPCLRST